MFGVLWTWWCFVNLVGERAVNETPGGAMRPSATVAGVNSAAGAEAEAGPVAGKTADAAAGAWLMRAVGAGAVLALLHELSGHGGFSPPWEPVELSGIPAGELYSLGIILLLPALLIFCAYFFVARTESRLNVRRQRGALALLGFAALFLALPLGSTTFSGVYGTSLLALAARTRDTLTVVTGVMALAVYVVSTFLDVGWVVLPVLGLMAVAAFTAARRVWEGS